MARPSPYRIRSIQALIAFESAARFGNFSRAARNLGTSQAAVSRHIGNLEGQLATQLFDRSSAGVTLTQAGRHFLESVVAGLGVIQAGATEASNLSTHRQVVIGCPHDASHLVVFPRYRALRAALGEEIRIRLVTYRRHPNDLPADPVVDVMLLWNTANPPPIPKAEDTALIFREEVRLICSPGYATTHQEVLSRPVASWDGLTFLDLDRPNMAWTGWMDIAGHPTSAPRYEHFDSYIQVLDAAAAGLGVALGWRHYIERYLDSGEIVLLDDGFVQLDGRFVAALTAKGRNNPTARKCLSFFETWTQPRFPRDA